MARAPKKTKAADPPSDGEPPSGGGARPPGRRRAVVPKVEGLPLQTARLVLRNAGFDDVRFRFEEGYAKEDHVLGQAPLGGLLTDLDTPVSLRVARTSWLTWLPGVFRQAADEHHGFLRNFLYVFQHLHAPLEWRVDDIHEVFDPRTAPAEMLPWLASWVGLVMGADWDERTRRRWIRQAPRLYASRGTKDCLVELIRIFTGLDVDIEENRWPYRGMRVGVSGAIGVDAVVMRPVDRRHAFIVDLPVPYSALSEQQVMRLHQVIAMEKPAHTTYHVRFQREDVADDQAMKAFLEIGATPIGVTPVGAAASASPDEPAPA